MQENAIYKSDARQLLPTFPAESVHLVIADPPYFRVLKHDWDNQWPNETSYLDWSLQWLRAAMRLLVPGGLLYCFGQVGKREHVFLHLTSRATAGFGFHDLIIWDRAVGYNERRDSFTPAYEQVLVLKKDGAPARFDKDAVRQPYNAKSQALYLRDKRYSNLEKRREHLQKGKFATNLWRIPSLKGTSKEKLGHPTQKPLELTERLVLSSSRVGDVVLDPFCGSGTALVAAKNHGRKFVGIEIDERWAEISRRRLGISAKITTTQKISTEILTGSSRLSL